MDQYRVLSPDGKEFGPVDLPGLLRWSKEGRLLKSTRVRKNDGEPVAAESLPELTEAFAPPPPQPSSPPIATTVAVPSEFKSWEFIGQAWALVKPNWLPLGLMFLILTLSGAVPYVGPCISLILSGTFMIGIYRAILGMLAGRPPTVEMMFSGFDRFGQAFLASLVYSVLVGLGFVACIVPGVILAIMWMFVSPILAETDLEFWPAMQASANLTKGYRWELFCLVLACIPILLLGILCCCIGVVVAQAVVFTAFALAYRFLQGRQRAVVTA
jgi:uncharacterized membrane protein